MPAEIISTGGASEPLLLAEAATWDEAAPEIETRRCEVPAPMHAWRADRALAALIPEFSRAYLQQLIGEGAVRYQGAPLRKAASRIEAGAHLTVELRPTQQAMAFVPQAMALDVVHEDADLMVLHKPAGLVVHPAAGHWSGTLLNGLLAHHAGAAQLPRAGIVHRLDKDTSGLMLVGKSRPAVDALVRAIAAREVRREYLALAAGPWRQPAEVQVDQPIGRDSHNRLRMAVVRPEAAVGKPAQTRIRLLQSTAQASLLACKLHTGRTHQIRVHMAWLGYPLVADTLYGGQPLLGMHRQALHATRLQLAHPTQGHVLRFDCPPPADMSAALACAGLRYNPQHLSDNA